MDFNIGTPGGASPSPTASILVRRKISQRAAEGVGPYDYFQKFSG